MSYANGLERRLEKDVSRVIYNKEIKTFVDRGVFKLLDDVELEGWRGQINYISHHGVPKPSSLSTAFKVVSNGSLENSMSGGKS